MSDIMLHGVLNMPYENWDDSVIDKIQRHSRYVEASKMIKQLEKSQSNSVKSPWIKQLENNFKHLNHNQGDLIRYDGGDYIELEYREPDNYIHLRGKFTIQQLEDLVSHMKKYKRE
ncbi:hypothetical protein KA005_08155 [bacterium]|nr:hypothetical protein [bacterium]